MFALQGPELVPQGVSSSSHQFNSLTSKSVPYPPGNPANLPVQEVGCSLIAASRKDKDIMTEEVVDMLHAISLTCMHKHAVHIYLH